MNDIEKRLVNFIMAFQESKLARPYQFNISVDDVTDNEFYSAIYFTLLHSDEPYSTPIASAELNYYLDCLTGKEHFSITKRNEIIRASV